jgi:hypothetical protein
MLTKMKGSLRYPGLVFLMVSPVLFAFGCGSDATGLDEKDDCREVGVLMICGADTTRVDTLGG